MARVPDLKRIKKEDFESNYQGLIDKLAFPLNSFMEQVRSAFSNNIDFQNLNQQVITLETTVDANGIPRITLQYKSNLSTRVLGHVCINSFNLTNTATSPTGQPFINFTQSEKLVTINHISGLQADQKYRLVVLSIGT